MKTLCIPIFFLLLLGLPTAVSAESFENIGFVQESIWYDREPFFAGDQVRVYSVLANSSGLDLFGIVVFSSGEHEIGRFDLSLPKRGGVQVVWADWVADAGEYTISARVIDARVVDENGEERAIELSQIVSSPTRFIDFDTDRDGIGNTEDKDDDNDGLSDNEERDIGSDPLIADTDQDGIVDGKDDNPLIALIVNSKEKEKVLDTEESISQGVTAIVDSTLPILKSNTEEITALLDTFRLEQKEHIDERREEVKAEIDQRKEQLAAVGETDLLGGFIKQAELLIFTIMSFTFGNRFLFFLVGGLLVLFVLVKLLSLLGRVFRRKPSI